MTNNNRNKELDKIEQDYVIAVVNSYNHFMQTYKNKIQISLSEYIQVLQLSFEHPELAEIFYDDNKMWWMHGGKPHDAYDIMG